MGGKQIKDLTHWKKELRKKSLSEEKFWRKRVLRLSTSLMETLNTEVKNFSWNVELLLSNCCQPVYVSLSLKSCPKCDSLSKNVWAFIYLRWSREREMRENRRCCKKVIKKSSQ